MAKKMKRKRFEELEYIIYKRDAMDAKLTPAQRRQKEGCAAFAAIFAVAAVAAVLLVIIVTNRSGYNARHCAKFGCNNVVAAGSKYCQTHTPGSTTKILPKKKTDTESKKSNDSITDKQEDEEQ